MYVCGICTSNKISYSNEVLQRMYNHMVGRAVSFPSPLCSILIRYNPVQPILLISFINFHLQLIIFYFNQDEKLLLSKKLVMRQMKRLKRVNQAVNLPPSGFIYSPVNIPPFCFHLIQSSFTPYRFSFIYQLISPFRFSFNNQLIFPLQVLI